MVLYLNMIIFEQYFFYTSPCAGLCTWFRKLDSMSNIETSSCLVWKHNSLSIIVCCSSFLETNMCSHVLHTLAGSPLSMTFVQKGRGKNEGSNLCSEHRLQTELPQWWQFFFPNPIIFRLHCMQFVRVGANVCSQETDVHRLRIVSSSQTTSRQYTSPDEPLSFQYFSQRTGFCQLRWSCASLSRNCILHCTALSKSWWWSFYPSCRAETSRSKFSGIYKQHRAKSCIQ